MLGERVEAFTVGVGAAVEGANVATDGADLGADTADVSADLLEPVEHPAEVDDGLAVALVALDAEVGAVVVLDLVAGRGGVPGRAGGRCGGALAVRVRSGDDRDRHGADGRDDRDEYGVAHVTGEVQAARQVLTPTSPSGVRPFSRWNARALARVSSP